MRTSSLPGAGLVLLLCACGPDPVLRDVASSEVTSARWSCVIGTEGGFSGGGDGYEVHSDGRVLEWSRATADAARVRNQLGTASQAQLDQLRDQLFAPELHRIEFQRTGNLTHFLEVSSEYARVGRQAPGGHDSSRREEHVVLPTRLWKWPADRMGGQEAKVPQRVQSVYESVLAVVRSISSDVDPK